MFCQTYCHHSSGVLHIEIVSVVLVHQVVEIISKAWTFRYQVVVTAVPPTTSVRIEAPGAVEISHFVRRLPAASFVLTALLVYSKVTTIDLVTDSTVLTDNHRQGHHQQEVVPHLSPPEGS